MPPIRNHDEHHLCPIQKALLQLGRLVRSRLKARFTRDPDLHDAEEGASDLQYPIDRLAESDILAWVEEAFPSDWGIRVLFEGGAPQGSIVREGHPRHVIVLDPVDGTRGLMHDKRSAWFLAGVAPDGPTPTLQSLTHACLLELPTSRSILSDVLLFGDGRVSSWTENVDSGAPQPLILLPSRATDLLHGFATVNRFLWRDAAIWGTFQDRLLSRLSHDPSDAGRRIFEDQYISNGGQLHGLMTGRDRLVVDLRPLAARAEGRPPLASHPYDLLALPIATSVGVIVTDAFGQPLNSPLTLTDDVAWIGYANASLRSRLEPEILSILHDLFPPS